jgi:transposase-like protein
MDILMDREKLKALAKELAKDIKTEADLNMLSRELVKLTIETALNAELTEHLGYEKHSDSKRGRGNTRNGSTAKRLKGTHERLRSRLSISHSM